MVFRDSFTAAVGGPTFLPGWRSNLFSRDIDYASAACWVVRREEHVARGGFDRSFHPAYFEDVDYAFRVEASGQRCRLNSSVPIVHHRGAGVARHRTDIAQQSHRRFQRRWAERLERQHARPSTDREALMCRDRLAESRTVFVARSEDLTAARFETMWGDASALAAAHPRRRISLITDVPVSAERVRVARAGGLEVIGAADAGSDLRGSVELWTSLADEVVGAPPSDELARQPQASWCRACSRQPSSSVLLIRYFVLRSPAGRLGADEAYTGIESFEILAGHFPLTLGGTVYTLPFEAYLYAPIAAARGRERRDPQAHQHGVVGSGVRGPLFRHCEPPRPSRCCHRHRVPLGDTGSPAHHFGHGLFGLRVRHVGQCWSVLGRRVHR